MLDKIIGSVLSMSLVAFGVALTPNPVLLTLGGLFLITIGISGLAFVVES